MLFRSYAVPVILGEIRALFRSGGTVKLSRSLQELSMRARELSDRYRADHQEEMTVNALAEALGVDVYQAALALSASRPTLSLSGEDEEGGVDIPVPSVEEALTDRLSLREALETLSDEDRELIELRYFSRKTQTATAEQLGTTQVQISRREKKILLKMRSMLV